MSSLLPFLAEAIALGAASCVLGMASSSRPRWRTAIEAMAIVLFSSFLAQLASVEAGWWALALACGAASKLAPPSLRDRLLMLGLGALTLATWRSGMGWRAEGLPLALAASGIAAPVLAAPGLAGLAWALGRGLRRIAPRLDVHDATLLTLLVVPCLAAGPTLAIAWQRAAIAAEGYDPAASTPTPIWPLLLALVAVSIGFTWRLSQTRFLRKELRHARD